MKKAEGKYVGVRAITREEAIEMAPEIFKAGKDMDNLLIKGDRFWAEGDKLRAEGHKLWYEGNELQAKEDDLRAKWYKLMAEGYRLRAEGDKLQAEGDKIEHEGRKLWANFAVKQKGHILPDWEAINFIAADLDDSVYCFNWRYNEIWIYDGENYPNRDEVEKMEWEKGDEIDHDS